MSRSKRLTRAASARCPICSVERCINCEAHHVDNVRMWMHPYLPRRNLRIVIHRWGSFSCAWRPTDSELHRRNLRIVIHRWGSFSCAWRPTDSELHRWPVDPTPGNVKLLLPPRQSRGNSHYGLALLNHIFVLKDSSYGFNSELRAGVSELGLPYVVRIIPAGPIKV
jgi:hypothetical protein